MTRFVRSKISSGDTSLHAPRAGKRPSNFHVKRSQKYFGIFCIVFVCLGILYVQNTKNILVPKKEYTVDKTVTLLNLNTKLTLEIPAWRWSLYVRFFAPTVTIQAGGYSVGDTEVTLENFLTKTLQIPTYKDLTVTILPGWNMWDIDAYLFSKEITKEPGEFIQTTKTNLATYQKDFSFLADHESLEGFLYPDTYRIAHDGSSDAVIRKMLKEFQKQIGEQYQSLDAKKAYETLILASIVEREERNVNNQPIVAGILSKRFKEGIPLGADATVCYGYEKTHKECTPSFIASVIYEKNIYNTRSTQGYPPTPIANMGRGTWKAAFSPEDSPYYYYLHDTSGEIHYAKNNNEHTVNKQKYLQ